MNNNQRTFAQEYVKNGNNGTRAYMKAYPDCTYETAKANASDLLTNTNVREYIESLQEKIEDKAIMTAKERMEWLTKVVKGEVTHTSFGSNGEAYENEAYISDKLKSIDIMNKMDGNYVNKVEGNIGITTIEVDIDE